MQPRTKNPSDGADLRVRICFALLIIVIGIFGIRLFYIQVIKHNYYKAAALDDQLKQYDIPATRGVIKIHNGDEILPLVLNQELFILFADPGYIKNADEIANKLVPIVGGNAAEYAEKMKAQSTRYVVLQKKLNPEQAKKVKALKYPGVGVIAQNYRAYPQGTLAAQLLGFVNDEGTGRYGVEQALNKQLKGVDGKMKAITDVNGVPLAASRDNVQVAPKNGADVVLNVDFVLQQKLESILKNRVKSDKATGASALIMDPRTGAVKAMANWPTYNPGEYFKIEDGALFDNRAVTYSMEAGSVMKPLTAAAAMDQGVVQPTQTYNDAGFFKVDDFKITNVEEAGGAGTRSVKDILNQSLNTGATWLLMQMGGGKLNEKGRSAWHDYLVNHYRFGSETGIEQGNESAGYVPKPEDNGAGINLTYANTAFGQAMTMTPIQLAAALGSIVNGGSYYQPQLVDKYVNSDGTETVNKPKILKKDVVSPKVSKDLMSMMEYTVENHSFQPKFDQSLYRVGGKTGTAQIAKPGGGYYEDRFNGAYLGYVGGDEVEYVIAVYVYTPRINGYAGFAAAQPVFSDLAHMLINNSYVTPKK